MPPKCPYCKVQLDYDEKIDECFDGEYYHSTWRGNCPTCRRDFQWNEIYLFLHDEEIKELE